MLLQGRDLEAAREYFTIITGDVQELKRLIIKAQDNPFDLLALLAQYVTSEQAEKSKFIQFVIRALEEAGYAKIIKFKPSALESTDPSSADIAGKKDLAR